MDKLRFILLFAVVLLAGSAAAYDFESGGLYYNILDADAKTVEVTNNVSQWESVVAYTGDISIPARVNYNGISYDVKQIGEFAFYESGIESVKIAYGVESISQRAFQYCRSLKSVDFPSSIVSIGYYAFYDCYYLNDFSIPENIKTIDSWAFGYVNNSGSSEVPLKIELPSTLESIGDYAFRGMSRLVYVISHIDNPFAISPTVFSPSESSSNGVVKYDKCSANLYVPIGTKAAYQSIEGWTVFSGIFEGVPQEITLNDGLVYSYVTSDRVASVIGYSDAVDLENLTIRSSVQINGERFSVKDVGPYAFVNCGSIRSVTIENGVEAIGDYAFRWCYQLETATLPSTITSLGNYCFYNSNRLSSIELPEGVQEIGRYAFAYSQRLRKVVLPSSITSIGDNAFTGLNGLVAVISHIQTPFEINKNVFVYSQEWNETDRKYDYTPTSATLYIPTGTIASYQAVEGWTMFANIAEGEYNEIEVENIIYSYSESNRTATVIGSNFTEYNQNVTIKAAVTINGVDYEVKSIGAGAFMDNGYISSLVISSGIETISQSAFQNCWNLKSVQLPSSLTTIGYGAFQSCNNLRRIEIPSSIDSLGNYAFAYCGNLLYVISHIQTPLNINGSVFCSSSYWSDGNQVFEKNNATLYVPEGTKAAYEAIDGWNMFADIVEGELTEETVDGIIYSYNKGDGTATVIGRADNELNDVIIHGTVTINGADYSVKTIGAGAFYDIRLNSVIIEDGVEIIEKQAFWDSNGINELVLPSTLKTIGDQAFTYAYITTIELPEGLDSIGQNAFANCYKMQRLILPSTLTRIGNEAFVYCNNLSSVISRIKVPVDISQGVFCSGWDWDENGNKIYRKSNATLYVPIGTKTAYEAIEGWNMFVDIIEGEVKETTYGGLNYSYVEGKGEATVISGDYSQITKLTIPGSIEVEGVSYIVKAIDNYVFSNCYSLDTLIIEDGVERIGQNAFYNCSNMKSVSLPTSLKSIGESSFAECNNITSLVIPEGVKTIGQNAFSWCNNMKLLELPSTLDSIGDYAFRRCYNLSRVVSRIKTPFKISKSVFCYEDYWENDAQVFRNSPATLYVPTGTKSAYEAYEGWNMFDGGIYEGDPKEGKSGIYSYIYMTDSKTATIVGVDDISQNKLEIPATAVIDGDSYKIIGIGNEVFSNKYLTSVIIPDGIETIGKRAFNQCYSLRSVKLPNSITSIGIQYQYLRK